MRRAPRPAALATPANGPGGRPRLGRPGCHRTSTIGRTPAATTPASPGSPRPPAEPGSSGCRHEIELNSPISTTRSPPGRIHPGPHRPGFSGPAHSSHDSRPISPRSARGGQNGKPNWLPGETASPLMASGEQQRTPKMVTPAPIASDWEQGSWPIGGQRGGIRGRDPIGSVEGRGLSRSAAMGLRPTCRRSGSRRAMFGAPRCRAARFGSRRSGPHPYPGDDPCRAASAALDSSAATTASSFPSFAT